MKLTHSLLLIGALAAGMVGGGMLSAHLYLKGMGLVSNAQQKAVYRLSFQDSAPWILGTQALLLTAVLATKGKDIQRDIAADYLKRSDVQKSLPGHTAIDLQTHFIEQEGKR